MADLGSASVSIKEAVKSGGLTVKIRIRGQRRFRVRLFIAGLLFRFGAWLIHAKSDVGMEIGDEPHSSHEIETKAEEKDECAKLA